MLQEYQYEVKYKTGRTHLDADCLSRAPVETREVTEENDVWAIDYDEKKFEDFKEEQWQDGQTRKVINDLRKQIHKKKFLLKNDILYYSGGRGNRNRLRVVVPVKSRNKIIEENHDKPTAGHLGVNRTIDRITKNYYWPRMRKSIYHYVQTCEPCQLRKGVKIAKEGLMVEMPIATKPFQIMGIDHLGPFPKSRQENRHLIVAIDYHTKWSEIKAVPDTSAFYVVEFLKERIIQHRGIPEMIITDLSSTFRSKRFNEFLREVGIKQLRTSGYHPRTNGLVERFNRTITDMISHYVSESQVDWDEKLNDLQYAYNTSRQESTKETPHQLLYGYNPVSTEDLQRGVELYKSKPEEQEKIRRKVIKRMKKMQEKTKKRFDVGRKNRIYEPKEKVLLYVPARKKGKSEKLLLQFKGPYEIVKRIYTNNYEIQDSLSGRKILVPVERLKKFYGRGEMLPTVGHTEVIC
jgi:transposase InsO family protein